MTHERTAELQLITEALGGVADSLAVDGYCLEVRDLVEQTLTVSVTANENACEECLVPKEVMAHILRSKLPTDVRVDQVQLAYPTDVS